MEDEEGYVALNLWTKKGGSDGPAPAGSEGTMEDEEGYTALNLRTKKGGSGGPAPARTEGSRQRPRWPQVVLGVGNIILALAVLLLAVCVSKLASEKGQTPGPPDSRRAGSGDTSTPPRSGDTSTPPASGDTSTPECSARLERFRSQLIQRLCPSARPGPAGGSGCKLCPTDWRLHGDKCYWVSRDRKTWNESDTDCSARGSQLLVIRDREELEFLKDLTQGAKQLWVGLSGPSPGKAWAWLDGSGLDLTLFPELGRAEGNSCGMAKGNQIRSDSCSSSHQWICQREAVLL